MRRSNKFGAVKVKDDGHTFDSKAEHRYYCGLKLRKLAGEVSNITVHKQFDLYVPSRGKTVKIGAHILDFEFYDIPAQKWRNVEVKGVDLPLGRWKRKHCEAEYGIKIEVVK